MNLIRVLVVDDHPFSRRAIAQILAEDPAFVIVGEAHDGEEALAAMARLTPDLVLMDINMPGLDGFSATRRITEAWPEARVVIVTVSDHVQDLFEAIKHGAQGYLLKNMRPDVWTEYLRAVARGEAPISKRVAAEILSEFTQDLGPEGSGAPDERLSEREREVLAWVAQGASNREIAAELYITENTVKNHLKNILAKLHLRNRVQLATYAIRRGIYPASPGDAPDEGALPK